MIIQYKCKFCSRDGGVEIEDNPDMFHVEKWKPLLCCNRCGDYMEKRRGLSESIVKSCVFLQQARATQSGAALGKFEAGVREKLTELTKRMAALVCDYYRKTNIWDCDFVNMLAEQPKSAWQIVNKYCNMVRTIQ